MTAIYQEIARPAPPVASTPAIDFAIVLARTIADLEKDPAQLRNVVYQLARVKLQQEAAQRDLPVSPLEMEHLTSALETAIDRVETMSLKHDNPRVLQSGADEFGRQRPGHRDRTAPQDQCPTDVPAAGSFCGHLAQGCTAIALAAAWAVTTNRNRDHSRSYRVCITRSTFRRFRTIRASSGRVRGAKQDANRCPSVPRA